MKILQIFRGKYIAQIVEFYKNFAGHIKRSAPESAVRVGPYHQRMNTLQQLFTLSQRKPRARAGGQQISAHADLIGLPD